MKKMKTDVRRETPTDVPHFSESALNMQFQSSSKTISYPEKAKVLEKTNKRL